MSRLRLFTLPVPPLPEQHRIVAKVDELMALCDELEARQERQRTTRRALTASSFDALANAPGADSLAKAWPRVRDHLDELITEPESIPTLRQAILQLAVRGQLVSQDPNDEPAKRLLLAVAQERAKLVSVGLLRGVSTPDRMTLTEELVELPTGWTWASAAEVVLAVTDGDHLPPPKTHSGVPFLVIGNVSKGALDFTDCRRVSRSYYDGLDWIRRPSRGDLLFTVTGSFGIVVPVETDEEFCVQRHIGILKCSKSIPPRYLRLALGSPQAREHSERVATGIAQKTVPLSGLRRLPIPLPPLPEQHRIVAKVDELMSLCDQLEARLTQARATTQALASSTTHHLVTPRGLPAGSSCLAS